ncbi:MAG: hypothetical protein U1F34_08395 [Gammaproteobacteria bacterium]
MAVATGCQSRQSTYFPLDAGMEWRYALRVVTMNGASSKKFLIANLPAITQNETKMVPRRTATGETTFYAALGSGIQRLGEYAPGGEIDVYPTAQTILPSALVPGATWQSNTRTAVLEVTSHAAGALYRIEVDVPLTATVDAIDDSIAVPAGTFTHCLRVHAVGITHADVRKLEGMAEIRVETTEWYAPDVGLVKVVRRETTSSSALPAGEYEMQLEALTRQ